VATLIPYLFICAHAAAGYFGHPVGAGLKAGLAPIAGAGHGRSALRASALSGMSDSARDDFGLAQIGKIVVAAGRAI
jgi:hypothetical protein